MGVFIIAIIVGVLVLNFVSQGISHSNLKKEQQARIQSTLVNFERRNKAEAQARDEYYDPVAKTNMPWFYADGSLKRDPMTGNTYSKGQYYATSHGVDCNLHHVTSDVKRPPSK